MSPENQGVFQRLKEVTFQGILCFETHENRSTFRIFLLSLAKNVTNSKSKGFSLTER